MAGLPWDQAYVWQRVASQHVPGLVRCPQRYWDRHTCGMTFRHTPNKSRHSEGANPVNVTRGGKLRGDRRSALPGLTAKVGVGGVCQCARLVSVADNAGRAASLAGWESVTRHLNPGRARPPRGRPAPPGSMRHRRSHPPVPRSRLPWRVGPFDRARRAMGEVAERVQLATVIHWLDHLERAARAIGDGRAVDQVDTRPVMRCLIDQALAVGDDGFKQRSVDVEAHRRPRTPGGCQ